MSSNIVGIPWEQGVASQDTAPQRLTNSSCWSELMCWFPALKFGIVPLCFWAGGIRGMVPWRGLPGGDERSSVPWDRVVKPTGKGAEPCQHPQLWEVAKEHSTELTGLQGHCWISETWIIQVSPCLHFSGAPNGFAVDFCLLHLAHDLWLTSRFHAFKVPRLVLLLLYNNPVSFELSLSGCILTRILFFM